MDRAGFSILLGVIRNALRKTGEREKREREREGKRESTGCFYDAELFAAGLNGDLIQF